MPKVQYLEGRSPLRNVKSYQPYDVPGRHGSASERESPLHDVHPPGRDLR